MNFYKFTQSAHGNLWIQERGITLYVRKHFARDGVYTIANMSAKHLGRKSLTRFLDKYENDNDFIFENVMNVRLIAYLGRRGYRVVTGEFEYPPTMERLRTVSLV